jgi:hypothetical protein
MDDTGSKASDFFSRSSRPDRRPNQPPSNWVVTSIGSYFTFTLWWKKGDEGRKGKVHGLGGLAHDVIITELLAYS